MVPDPVDHDQLGRRLRLMRQTLDELSALRTVDADRLAAEPLTRAAAERLLQVLSDLAVDVNGHLVVALTGRAPTTGRSSYLDAAGAGVLSPSLADRLAPVAGLRNLLVHRYADIRVDLVAAAVPRALDDFADYVREVAGFLEAHE